METGLFYMASRRKSIPDIEAFARILRSRRLKATPQRIAVHSAMLELGHASADMVSSHITSSGTRITVASVYNILSQMAEIGVYSRRLSADSRMYFDVNTSLHAHLYDTTANGFRDIEDEELMAAIESLVRKKRFKGYKIDRIDVHLLCHPTRKSK